MCVCNCYIANKFGFVQIIPPSWGLSCQFDWHAINLRANQNDMTHPIRWYYLHKPEFFNM